MPFNLEDVLEKGTFFVGNSCENQRMKKRVSVTQGDRDGATEGKRKRKCPLIRFLLVGTFSNRCDDTLPFEQRNGFA